MFEVNQTSLCLGTLTGDDRTLPQHINSKFSGMRKVSKQYYDTAQHSASFHMMHFE